MAPGKRVGAVLPYWSTQRARDGRPSVRARSCGGTLVVPSLDRLGRSIQDLIAIVSGLRKRGVGFTSLHEALDTTTPGGRLVLHVFVALAEFIRELIVQGTNEGLDAARARGARLGHPPAMTDEQVRHARDLLAHPENTVTSIAKLLEVSRNTISRGGSRGPSIAPRAPRSCRTSCRRRSGCTLLR
ncbi:recombinase family protein [Streptomyces canus]|uniref:recombinase family protein n=1 Tax=Streptomyces canus TaxID=58343 RepID=UPI00225C25E7|nr:recombinase family protein [Streptomyces canus]MCX4862112.1 recombinase family protein [Streptomyces canus]